MQKDEHVLIEAFDIPVEMTIAIIRAARAVGAHAHVAERSGRIVAELYRGEEKNLAMWGEYDLERMKRMHAYLGVRGGHNVSEQTLVKGDEMKRAARNACSVRSAILLMSSGVAFSLFAPRSPMTNARNAP